MLRKLSCVQCGTLESVFMEKSFPAIADQSGFADRDGNENDKKAIGFCKENDNFARASRLSVHFFVVTAWIRRKYASSKKRHAHTQARLKQSISVHRQSSEILDNNSNDFLSQILPITKTAVST